MSDPNLFDFADVLASAGHLRRVTHDAAARFEMAEYVRQLRSRGAGTPAVLFERVPNRELPVLASFYASDDALAAAFDTASVEDIAARITDWLRPRGRQSGRGVRDVLAMLPTLTRTLPWTDSGRQARSQQVVRLGRDVDLERFPILHSWPAESGPTITAGLILTRAGEDEQTVETGIAEVVDAETLRIRFADGSPGLAAWSAARATGRQLDVAIAMGGPPSLWPTVWLGEVLGIDAGVLGEVFNRPQPETVRGRTVSVAVPSSAEVIFEGRIDPDLGPAEPGRVATDWGYVSSSGQWATMSVHAITHAAAAVFPAIVRHGPPHDLVALNRLAERCLEELVCALVPGVSAVRTPPWGQARQTVIAAIAPEHASRAREIASAIRGLHGLSRSKAVVLLDDEIPLDDPQAVLAAIIRSAAPQRDIRIVDAIWNADDPSGYSEGSAVIIDATTAVKSAAPRKARPSPSVAESVRAMLRSENGS